MFERERGDPSFLKHGVAQVGTEGQVMNPFGTMAKNTRNVADFKH
jgi:hypothetical protein